jgi:hypothetical protein
MSFAKRKCDHCGTRFDPAGRSSNPANASKMRFCSPQCKNAAWRNANREKVRETNRRVGAAWYAGLDEEARKKRFAQIAAAKISRETTEEG